MLSNVSLENRDLVIANEVFLLIALSTSIAQKQ